ncbi:MULTISPECIES: NAD-dependent epimerase/dehydratase family protein [unclassified Pseudomonas]|uniref:NAD-dependent epimerase/dehydratase family protein n=1 Tax=unclassified Pseudomonas TaxID=196821 RepID=UPI0035C10CF1
MKVFVTGASGFIGRALCQALVAQGDEVIALVRSSWQMTGVQVVKGDLEALPSLEQVLVGVDCVVHLAGRAHLLRDNAADPLVEFRNVNRDATERLAKIARAAGVKRFVFMSSIGVNGSHTQSRPFDETSAVNPHAPYALSKLEAEQSLAQVLHDSATDHVIIRPPLVYAADAPGNFGRLLKLVGSGLPLPLAGLRNSRNMVALENLVDFILLACRAPAAADQVYLVADDQAVSTSDIVRLIGEGMQRRVLNLPVPEPMLGGLLTVLGKGSLRTQLCGSLEVDNRKARSLGWTPRVTAQQALVAAGRDYRRD